jgi:nitroreductase
MNSKKNNLVLNAICERRSIRQYLKDMPTESQIKNILDAGRWAPSGLNNQPWRFVVVKDKALKDKLAKLTKYSQVVNGAPIAICVFMDIRSSYNRDKDILAIGACIQHMLLCAHSQGLATCWLGEILNKKDEVSALLDVDSDFELMAVIVLGYSDEQITKSCRKSLKSLILREY